MNKRNGHLRCQRNRGGAAHTIQLVCGAFMLSRVKVGLGLVSGDQFGIVNSQKRADCIFPIMGSVDTSQHVAVETHMHLGKTIATWPVNEAFLADFSRCPNIECDTRSVL